MLIQRAKAWRNKQWPNVYPGQKKPKSYFLSLLVLKAYQRAKKKFGNQIFRDMAEKYVHACSYHIIVYPYIDLYIHA